MSSTKVAKKFPKKLRKACTEPVLRWVEVTDESGATRLEMRWLVEAPAALGVSAVA